jgi:hypothetical protein
MRGRIRRDNVGKIALTAGAGSDLPKTLRTKLRAEGGGSQKGLAQESVGAKTEE